MRFYTSNHTNVEGWGNSGAMGTQGVQVAGGSFQSGQFVADTDTVLYNGAERWTVDQYRKADSEAAAWRSLWTQMLKNNKKLKVSKKRPGDSPLVRAQRELARLYALDRTLERRLKGD